MRAGFYVGDRTYEVREVPEKVLEKDEVKIEVAWCGLCGTDIHKYNGKNGASVVIPPVILGHECSGIVAETGEDVCNFKVGDRVAVDPSWGCGKCEFCQEGLPNFCVDRHGVAKGFADYIYPPEQNVYHLPEGMNLKTAAFAEPLSCVLHGLDLIEIKSGKNVLIYGMGSIGGLMLQTVKHLGAGSITVVEKEEEKRNIALKLGADRAVTSEEVSHLAEKINFDYVIECIGLKVTMEQAIAVAGKKSKVLLFGLGDPEENISFQQFDAYRREVSIYTSYLNPHTTARAIALLNSGAIDTEAIISAELSLEEMEEELKTLKHSRKGKVMVRLSGRC